MSSPEANTPDVLRSFLGKTLNGLMLDVQTVTPNVTETHLVFSDGTALALQQGAQYRSVAKAVVEQEASKKQDELDKQQSDLGNVSKKKDKP